MKSIHPDTQAIIDHYQFDRIPLEGTLYKRTYRSASQLEDGRPYGTAIMAMYSDSPRSFSCFHRLSIDEIWHFYGGDPLRLFLLHEDGNAEVVVMGNDPLRGQRPQFVVPANSWQAGEMVPGGRYSLFGCTLAPGFSGEIFEAGLASELTARFPAQAEVIRRLGFEGPETRMPDGYQG